MRIPTITALTIATTASSGSTFNIDMSGANTASLQLHGALSGGGATDVITLKISNDNINYVGFSTAKTVTFTQGGTVDALFELGTVDYAWLQVSYATPSAGTITLTGTLYATATITRDA